MDNYKEIRNAAQECANRDGFDYGVFKGSSGYFYGMLPMKKNRYGHELRCEVVMCETLSKCRPGHGPTA